MFIVVLTYTVPLEQIDVALPEHVAWLDEQYADGVFVLSGRRVPRTGGVILAVGTDADDLQRRLDRDPFGRRGYARYEVIEVSPTRTAPGLEQLRGEAVTP
jgi:uncharacterized protein YciI